MAISNLRAVSHLKKINDTSKQPTSKCKKKDICLQNQIFHCRSVRRCPCTMGLLIRSRRIVPVTGI